MCMSCSAKKAATAKKMAAAKVWPTSTARTSARSATTQTSYPFGKPSIKFGTRSR